MSALPVRFYSAFPFDRSGGNIGAVVLLDAELEASARQRVARDLGAPTTGFVRRVGDGFEVRFHSTRAEMAMCGHVTLAVFAALRDEEWIEFGEHVQMTRAGPVYVHVHQDGQINMRQPLPKFDFPGVSVDEIAPLLSFAQAAVCSTGLASTGLTHLFVEVTDTAHLAALRPDDAALLSFSIKHKIDTIGVWCMETTGHGEAKVRLRDLCHGVGDSEEAASGTTNGALACHLWRTNRIELDRGAFNMVGYQGFEMGQPSVVETKIQVTKGNVSRVRVGGRAELRMVGRYVC